MDNCTTSRDFCSRAVLRQISDKGVLLVLGIQTLTHALIQNIHHTQGDSPRMVIRLRCNLLCLRSKKEKRRRKERGGNGNVTQGLRGQYYFRYRGFSSGRIQPGGSIIEALSAEARSPIQQPPGFERKGIEETGTLEQSVLVGMLYLALSQLWISIWSLDQG